jgi:hypothetical protein
VNLKTLSLTLTIEGETVVLDLTHRHNLIVILNPLMYDKDVVRTRVCVP